MYKNWDMKQLSLKNMSEEETTQFFKDAKTSCGGNFSKGKVKALLEKKMIQYETNQVETKIRKKEEKEKDEEDDAQDYMSISSDDDKPKVVYVQGGPKGKAKAAPKKNSKPDMTEDELKALKDENSKEIVKGAKKIQEKYKGRTWEALTFEHTEQIGKDLKESLLKGCKCIDSVESMLNGGFDEEQIKRLAEQASEKKKEIAERAEQAEDVS
eukprot:s590_g21.t1